MIIIHATSGVLKELVVCNVICS